MTQNKMLFVHVEVEVLQFLRKCSVKRYLQKKLKNRFRKVAEIVTEKQKKACF